MTRVLLTFAALPLLACGGDPAPGDSAAVTASSASGPVEVRLVSDDPAVRQRLTPPQLLAYYPAELGGREPNLRSIGLNDSESESEYSYSYANVRYRMPPTMDQEVEFSVYDYVDNPSSLERHRRAVMTGEGLSISTTGEVSEARTLEGGVGRSYTPSSGAPEAYILLADRFHVIVRAQDPEMTVEDVWGLFDASGLSRLAGAGVYGEPDPLEPPAWASGAIAEWRENVAEAEATPAPQAAPEVTPLADCDVILPLAEVERVCGVTGLRVKSTPFETEGQNCNRTYNRQGQSGGLILLVSHFSNERTALAAQSASMNFADQRSRRDISGLGDAATRVIHDLSPLENQNSILTVASGVDMVELKSADYSYEPRQQVCNLDQMETIARGVVSRLAE
ncbi:hypothetical protein [Rubricoccus marinus]|uniref:Uncharacterized protein n=1 Tax=Rubricoccus marinus TaxID=716817 RepID=A0A259TX64_9BACT|nr:hypothetical protein [Rubricoccus marinus]OZC02359.1 hypothetical protein BSZ36_04830 [Rubricoccus marinus]